VLDDRARPPPGASVDGDGARGAYAALLRAELLGAAPSRPPPSPAMPSTSDALSPSPWRGPSSGARVFGYRAPPPTASPARRGLLVPPPAAVPFASPHATPPRAPPRKVSRAPFKVLDAPGLADDFYLNLVDWSASNVLAVGLGTCVYLWSACTSSVTKLCDLAEGGGAAGSPGSGGDAVTSVGWSGRGSYLAVGSAAGDVHLYDVGKAARVRTLGGHRGRVGAVSWCGHSLATGSRDRAVLVRDARAPGDVISRLAGHRSEVCGLRWSPDGATLATATTTPSSSGAPAPAAPTRCTG